MRPASSARSLSVARRQHTLPIPCRSVLGSRPYSDVSPAQSSSSSSSQPAWPRPLPEGRLPAFDLALDFIRSRDAKLAERRQGIAEGRLPKGESVHSTFNLKGADQLDVRIHDPEVRWRWKQGIADPHDASSKYFEIEKFELEGGLDLHRARIEQMHVVPDVTMLPSGLVLDFGFRFPAPPPPPAPKPDEWGWVKKVRPYETRDNTDEGRVLCGSKLTVKESLVQPELHIRHFGHDHKGGNEHKRYTILMLDADVPDPANFSFTQKILWMVPNIDLSPSTRVFPSPDFPVSKNARHVAQLPPALIPYLPPHPTQGSGDHRFTFLVLRHNGPITFGEKDARGVVAIPDRDDFNFRQWSQSIAKRKIKTDVQNKEEKKMELGLNVVGCSFFRSSYDPVECPKIWQLLIQKPEVKFNIPGGTSNREYLTSLGQNKVQKWNLENNFTGPKQPEQGIKPRIRNKYDEAYKASIGPKSRAKRVQTEVDVRPQTVKNGLLGSEDVETVEEVPLDREDVEQTK